MNIWRGIKDRADIQIIVTQLPDGVEGLTMPTGWGWAILLNKGLSPEHRRAVLAHELEHIAEGGGVSTVGMPASWAVVAARQERRMDRRASVRLLDRVALDALHATGETMTVEEVADALGVPVWVLDIA